MSYFSPGVVRFASFEFDPRHRELRKHGMRVKLTPHEMSLLCLLLEPPLRIRTRDEIQHQLWPANTFVEVSGFIHREWLVEIEADCVADA